MCVCGGGGLHNSSTELKFNLLSAIIKTEDESELAVLGEGDNYSKRRNVLH